MRLTEKNKKNLLKAISLCLYFFLFWLFTKVYILPIISTSQSILLNLEKEKEKEISFNNIKMPKLSQLEYGFVMATIIGVFAIRLIDKDLVQPSGKDMEEINDFIDLYSIRINRKKGWKSVLDYQLLTLAKEKNTSLNEIKSIFYDYYFSKHSMDHSGSRFLYLLNRQSTPIFNYLVIISGFLVAIIPVYNWVTELVQGNRIAEEKNIKEAWDNLAKYKGQKGNLGRQGNLEFLNRNKILLYNLELEGVALPKINLEKVDLQYSNLKNSKLIGANFGNANLNYVIFAEANLSYAKLTDSKLIQTDLTNADLTNADLTNADISEANLTDAKGLTLEQLKKTKNWKLAKYSDSFLKDSGICEGEEKPNQCLLNTSYGSKKNQ